MKKLRAVLIGASALSLAACGQQVQSGMVGIQIDNYGSGVQPQSLPPGIYHPGIGVTIDPIKVSTQTYTYSRSTQEGKAENEEITFQSKEGLPVSADVAVSYHVDPALAPKLYVKYREDPDVIVEGPLRNTIRDGLQREASNLTIDQIYGPGKAALLQHVQDDTFRAFNPYGLVVEKLYWANTRIPENVQAQINQRISNEQQAIATQAGVATHEALAKQKEADAAGDAEQIQIESAALEKAGPNYVQLKAVQAWDRNGAKMPTYWSAGQPLPFVGVK